MNSGGFLQHEFCEICQTFPGLSFITLQHLYSLQFTKWLSLISFSFAIIDLRSFIQIQILPHEIGHANSDFRLLRLLFVFAGCGLIILFMLIFPEAG